MGKNVNLVGQTFGRLTVLEFAGFKQFPCGAKQKQWKCKCNCNQENIIYALSNQLLQGNTKSCGCLRKEMSRERNRKYNTYDFIDNYVIIHDDKDNVIYVDLQDFNKIKNYYWTLNDQGYALARINGHQVRMHRYILDYPKDKVIDHIGGSQTRNDNRRKNLRITTTLNNNHNHKVACTNTSGVTGVSWHKGSNKWMSMIHYNNQVIYLGIYTDLEDAIAARKEAERKYYGEYSYDASQELASQQS